MKWGSVLAMLFGVLLVALGGLWFLQGSDVVHLAPILCVANCEPLVGRSPQWQAAGAVAVLAGGVLVGVSARRTRNRGGAQAAPRERT